eukprot:gene24451-28558_t
MEVADELLLLMITKGVDEGMLETEIGAWLDARPKAEQKDAPSMKLLRIYLQDKLGVEDLAPRPRVEKVEEGWSCAVCTLHNVTGAAR